MEGSARRSSSGYIGGLHSFTITAAENVAVVSGESAVRSPGHPVQRRLVTCFPADSWCSLLSGRVASRCGG